MLPVDSSLPEILDALDREGALVLEAPPGTGKTTRVPVAVAQRFPGQVLVLEPRRIAARAAAGFVARERGEVVGGYVGYAMRLERRAGPETRVLYVTEALLTRRLASDPDLSGVGAVILDEFHERSIHADVALAWVRELRRRRPELRLLVMSATLDGERISAWLGCPRIRVVVERFPLEIDYLPRPDDRYLEQKVGQAVRGILSRESGDVLVFLPGAGEIRRVQEQLSGVDAEVLPLHGELSSEEQDRALRRGRGRKVVLTTNVAETSVTVDGVSVVVDTGLARVPGHDAWSGMGTLDLCPISRASATQRAGRAARQGPGRCLRLYTRGDHDARPADTEPEIKRMDLAGTVLDLGGRELLWLDPPPPGSWLAARQLLQSLGAIGPNGRTSRGDRMVRLPVSPRVAAFLLDAAAGGAAAEAASLAVRLGERRRAEVVDLVDLALSEELNGRQRQEHRQIVDLLERGRPTGDLHSVLTRALFQAFSDRVGKRRGTQVLFSGGGSAVIDAAAPGGDGFVVVTEVERVGRQLKIRSLSPIPADWLLDAAEVRAELRWVGERVEQREQWMYGALVIEEGPGQGEADRVADLLWEHARPVSHRVFPDHEAAVALVRRVAWLRRIGLDLPALDLDQIGREACQGMRSFSDLGGCSLLALTRQQIQGVDVDRLAPERLWIGGNRKGAPVDYPEEGDPYISARLQDFFGMADGPRIADGRPLVLHLLAPNHRPVQVTTDLRGFWERHYPAVRRELMRRYPRHAWPEDPMDPASIEAARPVPRRT